MPAPVPRSAEASSSPSAAPSGVPGSAAATSSGDVALPVVGECWRGKYQISEQLPEAAGTQSWRGTMVEGGHRVILRAFRPAEPEIRAQAWSKLGGIDSPHLQHARDAQRAGDWRVEISDEVNGTPLHLWRASKPSIDTATIRTAVGQLADALGALHAFELVHLGLRPEVIMVSEDGAGLRCVIGGLDTLTTFDRKDSVPVEVDPFYAPPEALGLHVHLPGPGLCGWDWWSLGRVVQETVLGRHIVAQLTNSDARLPGPEAKSRAEALLLEADAKGPRAGAVELMSGLDASLAMLLRGLLTSAKEARWTNDNVDRWVRGQTVKEHYDSPRSESHFRWRGRPCTLPEIAAILQSAEHWAENSAQLYESTSPGTLAHFLRWSPSQAAGYEALTSALELAEALPLKLSSAAAQREAVAMVGLLQLSAGKLVWRGRAFDGGTVAAMIDELGEVDAIAVLRALSTRSTALQIERVDAAAGRALTELGRTAGDVESFFKRHGWLGPNDGALVTRIFRQALDPAPTLRSAREALAQQFAGSDHAAMNKVFQAANVGRSELVVLAVAAAEPARYKFFTHAEAARRRAEALRARGAELISTLTWARYEQALGVGRVVFSGWGWFLATWLVAAVVALLLWPGVLGAAYAAVPLVVALLLRVALSPRNARALRERLPEARWTWKDGPARCRRELRLAGNGVAREKLEAELSEVTAELAKLKDVQPPPAPLPDLPRFPAVRLAGWVSWAVVAAFVEVGGWRVHLHPPSAKEIKAAWAPAKPAKPDAAAKAKLAAAKEEDHDVKITWPFRPGDSAVKVTVRGSHAATSAQSEYATKHGRDLVAPYRLDTVSTYVIMPVPGGENTVMIFDGKRGALVNEQVYELEFDPIPRTWVDIGGHKGVFLDQ